MPWAKSALKAYAKVIKKGSVSRSTQESTCDLASQLNTKVESVRFSSDVRDYDLPSQPSVTSQPVRIDAGVVRRVCSSPSDGGTQVSACDPLNQSSVAMWSSRLNCTEVSLRVPSSIHGRMAYKCNQCQYISKVTNEMCSQVMQAHLEEKHIPFKCRICGACKLTANSFHTHHRKNHQGHLDPPLGNGVPITEQDFIPRHFIQMTNVVQPSAEEPGEPVGAACPPVPEPSTSASECPEDPE